MYEESKDVQSTCNNAGGGDDKEALHGIEANAHLQERYARNIVKTQDRPGHPHSVAGDLAILRQAKRQSEIFIEAVRSFSILQQICPHPNSEVTRKCLGRTASREENLPCSDFA